MENRVKRTTRQVIFASIMSFIMAFTCVFGIFYSTSVEVVKLADEGSITVHAASEPIENKSEITLQPKLQTLSNDAILAVDDIRKGAPWRQVPLTSRGTTFSRKILENDVQANNNLQVEESAEIDVVTTTVPQKVEEPVSTTVEEAISTNTTNYETQQEPAVVTTDNPVTVDDPIVKFGRNTDLAANRKISVEKMNTVIAKSAKMCGGTPFEGQGAIFIEAAEKSGLDPIYIFAHASWESGYGKSSQARNKHNYFGIASFDSNPNAAYVMGDDMRAGIVNGAIWIADHYYKQGQTTLHLMIYGKKRYASAGDKWINGILGIMNRYTD